MNKSIVEEFRKVAPKEWLAHSEMTAERDLHLKLPPPCGSDCGPIWVQIDGDYDEIIVGFAGAHSHGGSWREVGDPDHRFQGTLSFVSRIKAEAVVAYTLPGHGGGFQDSAAIPSLPKDAVVRSWKGTHNRGNWLGE